MRRYPLIAFFIIACLITWSIWIPRALAANGLIALQIPEVASKIAYFVGPPIAALIVTWHAGGRAAISDLLKRSLVWRVGMRWYLIAVFARAAMLLVALAVGIYLGMLPATSIQPLFSLAIPDLVLDFVARLIRHSGEEFAWRGYGLAHVQTYLRPVPASILIGLIWAIWHLPLFFIPDTAQYGIRFVTFLIWLLAMSLIHTLLYNNTRGSVVVASVFHAAYNTTTTHIPGIPLNLDIVATWLIAGVLTIACALTGSGLSSATAVRSPTIPNT